VPQNGCCPCCKFTFLHSPYRPHKPSAADRSANADDAPTISD
jgi:hypothetical protein